MKKKLKWEQTVLKHWKNTGVPPLKKQATLLRQAIALLDQSAGFAKSSLALPEQPFDRHLLDVSPLYRRSRKLFLDQGGKFIATLVSSPRSLSSAVLLEQTVEYSPIERELIWTALDPAESKKPKNLLHLRSYSSSLFHEQNHRILWKLLPRSALDSASLRRYLNFTESLVITLDMALSDHLGPQLASLFYLTGVIYDPGTSVCQTVKTKREYRNYLQAALHATYLHLEMFDPQKIPLAIEQMFPLPQGLSERAANRSGRLDPAFIQQTNPFWQKRHKAKTKELLTLPQITLPKTGDQKKVLQLPADPLDNREQYLIAEKLFDLLELG